MGIKTRVTELLGIEHPILGGTMMDLSVPSFVAAISNAGALGILASAIYRKDEALREALRELKDLTDKPFAVNINLFPMMAPPNNKKFVEILAEFDVKIVETSGFGAPVELIELFRQHGMTWLHKCVGVRYAQKVAGLGADGVTVVGFENGGATGNLNVTTLVLVPSVVDAVDIPVVGGGGVVDGRTLHAVLALGADAAIVGTRLMLSEECPIHDDLKRALCEASELDTDIIMRSLNFAHRVWLNEPAKKVVDLEEKCCGLKEIYPYVSGESAKKMYESGDLNAGTVSCSQGIGLIKRVMPVKEILAEMVEGAKAQQERLAGLGL